MPGTNFIDKNTVITAVYMNGVDAAIYDAIGDGVSPPSSPEEVKTNLNLDNVDNISDLNKPISTATQAALDLKAAITYVDSQDALKSDITTTVVKDSSTGAGQLPAGTTAQRPVAPADGYIRYNTTTLSYEGYTNGNWLPLGGDVTLDSVQTLTNKTLTSPSVNNLINFTGSGGALQVAGVDKVVIDTTGITSGYGPLSITSAALADAVKPLGVGQTHQNMTGLGGRAVGVDITNTSGRTIWVSVQGTLNATGANIAMLVGGVQVDVDQVELSGRVASVSAPVPAGAVYRVNQAGGVLTISVWDELRV